MDESTPHLPDGFTLSGLTRDKVLVPVMGVLVLVALARVGLTKYFDRSPPKKPARAAFREQRALARGQILRANSSQLSPGAFSAHRSYMQRAYKDGQFLKPPPAGQQPQQTDPDMPEMPPNPLGDPASMETMMDGMKKQFAGFIPQTLSFWLINRNFDGFVLARAPLPMPRSFKPMLQRGLHHAAAQGVTLDPNWISSTSWYFLALFASSSVFALILPGGRGAQQPVMMPGMPGAGGPPGAPGQQQDFKKLYQGESQNLELVEHEWACKDVDKRLLERASALKGR